MAAVQRQARGRARMEQILDAATEVFARDGIERASTNAIAARAGISPGSLYQYYADRADILGAVAARYAQGLGEVYAGTLEAAADRPLDELVAAVLVPIVEFKRRHAAFVRIYSHAELPPTARDAVGAVNSAFEHSLHEALVARSPDADPDALRAAIVQAVALVRGQLPLLGTISGDEDADVRELAAVIAAYLTARGAR